MTDQVSMFIFAGIGVAAGLLSGLFGIGGGIVIMPALIYLAGFDQHRATGTSLAILLPPIGLGAAIEYYRHGAVDIRAAAIVAVCVFLSAWLSSIVATRISATYLRLAFGIFVIIVGVSLVGEAARKLGWF
jgi:uncharacterized membrane protein YfcA